MSSSYKLVGHRQLVSYGSDSTEYLAHLGSLMRQDLLLRRAIEQSLPQHTRESFGNHGRSLSYVRETVHQA